MKFNFRLVMGSASLASAGLVLSACTGAPAPCTETDFTASNTAPKTEQIAGDTQQQLTQNATEKSNPSESSKVTPSDIKVSVEEAPKPTPPAKQPTEQIEDNVPTSVTEIDPYTAFPAMANAVFEYADTLYRQGKTEKAIAYLQRFRIIKPLWNQWENQTDSMLTEFSRTNAERTRQFEPLVLEIQNMNRVNADYSLVAATADSLISLAPGDSLTQFATEQKKVAYRNTLTKALKEKKEILNLAEQKARFKEALDQASSFQLRYRDFESELKIEAMINSIQELQNSVNEEDQKFWETNDPQKALTEIDQLIEKKSYDKAKTLIEKLKASKLRKQAFEKMQKLADGFCTEKRKTATQLYAKSKKQKDSDKKKQLLNDAITALSSCSENFPEYEKIKTVTDNINFIKNELKF